MRTIGRLYGESPDGFGESANDDIPTGGSAVELADSGLESADSTADSAKVGIWVRA